MAATLTWLHSGLGAKSGTTAAALITDVVALVNSFAGNPAYQWQVASSSVAGPNYCVLKRKDGSAGRLLLLNYGSSPAGVNPTLFQASPLTALCFFTWFPNGNTDVPLNLTAASGTILGNDAGAVRCGAGFNQSTVYVAGVQPCYFESADGIVLGFFNPTTPASSWWIGAGNLIVDNADQEYGCCFTFGNGAINNFGAQGMNWNPTVPTAGSSANGHVRTNFGSFDRAYYQAYNATAWQGVAAGPTDILTDTAISRAWFVPIQLVGNTKGEGFPLKLRQIAIGPTTTAAFSVYNTTGPVVAARQFCGITAGSGAASFPWLTNFKV